MNQNRIIPGVLVLSFGFLAGCSSPTSAVAEKNRAAEKASTPDLSELRRRWEGDVEPSQKSPPHESRALEVFRRMNNEAYPEDAPLPPDYTLLARP